MSVRVEFNGLHVKKEKAGGDKVMIEVVISVVIATFYHF